MLRRLNTGEDEDADADDATDAEGNEVPDGEDPAELVCPGLCLCQKETQRFRAQEPVCHVFFSWVAWPHSRHIGIGRPREHSAMLTSHSEPSIIGKSLMLDSRGAMGQVRRNRLLLQIFLVVLGRNNPSLYTVKGRPLYVPLNGLAIVLLK